MNSKEIILQNFSEIRRRSIKLWKAIPEAHYWWKPDKDALSILEMIRHVLEAEHLYHVIIQRKGNLGDYQSPWEGRTFVSVQDELQFAEPYRDAFLTVITTFTEAELKHFVIDRTEVNQRKILGDYLLRIAYHESVHTGQMLAYLRTFGLKRPSIWD